MFCTLGNRISLSMKIIEEIRSPYHLPQRKSVLWTCGSFRLLAHYVHIRKSLTSSYQFFPNFNPYPLSLTPTLVWNGGDLVSPPVCIPVSLSEGNRRWSCLEPVVWKHRGHVFLQIEPAWFPHRLWDPLLPFFPFPVYGSCSWRWLRCVPSTLILMDCAASDFQDGSPLCTCPDWWLML